MPSGDRGRPTNTDAASDTYTCLRCGQKVTLEDVMAYDRYGD